MFSIKQAKQGSAAFLAIEYCESRVHILDTRKKKKEKKDRAVCHCDECHRCSVVSSDDRTKQLLLLITYTCESRYYGCVFCLSYLKICLKE